MLPPWPDFKPAGLNSSGYFNQSNQGKRGITPNFKDPAAIEVARRLVAKSELDSKLSGCSSLNSWSKTLTCCQ
jgi:hypothetical protein